MPLPLLAPIIGGLIGTAAAPALGMSTALAAGLGSFAGGIISGQNPAQAALGGIMGALVPGIAGVAGKGAEAAAQATTRGAQMTANQIAQQTAASSLGPAATKEALTQATKGIGAIDPEAALEMGAQMLSGGQGQEQRQAPPVGPLRMRLGEEQAPTSADAMSNFLNQPQPQPPVSAAPAPLVVVDMEDPERKFIPLRLATGGVASLARAEMARRNMSRLPNLGDREQAYAAARREFARGGYIEGPGTGTSDDIPAKIMQNGIPVDEALLSDGEVVLSHKDLAAVDPDGDSQRAGRLIGGAPNGTRAKKAAELYMKMPGFKEGVG